MYGKTIWRPFKLETKHWLSRAKLLRQCQVENHILHPGKWNKASVVSVAAGQKTRGQRPRGAGEECFKQGRLHPGKGAENAAEAAQA